MTQEELNEVLRKHNLWLEGKEGGKRRERHDRGQGREHPPPHLHLCHGVQGTRHAFGVDLRAHALGTIVLTPVGQRGELTYGIGLSVDGVEAWCREHGSQTVTASC